MDKYNTKMYNFKIQDELDNKINSMVYNAASKEPGFDPKKGISKSAVIAYLNKGCYEEI
tara:strand:+ start:530 stop:706 length:177 start_codon:yes stop_codon:yes gene_type:complete